MAKLSEEQVEARVCRMMDVLDYRYLRSPMTEAEYLSEIKAIDAWAQRFTAEARKRRPDLFKKEG